MSEKQNVEEQQAVLLKTEQLLQALQTGLLAQGPDKVIDNSYMGQIQDAKNLVQAAITETKQLKLRFDHCERELKEKEIHLKKNVGENTELVSKHEHMLTELAELVSKRSLLNAPTSVPEKREHELLTEKATLEQAIQKSQESLDEIVAHLSQLEFVYKDPCPGFDRKKVKGLVAKLVTLNAQRIDTATALEVTASGRLFNVVVKDEHVASQLLEKGQLQKRTTIIPLSKIARVDISKERILAAKALAPGKVELALSLIGYEPDVTAAMEYIFGNTLICEGMINN